MQRTLEDVRPVDDGWPPQQPVRVVSIPRWMAWTWALATLAAAAIGVCIVVQVDRVLEAVERLIRK